MKKRRVWLSGDWHKNHPKIVNMCARPHNYEDLIIKRHSVIEEEDTLIVVGDVILYSPLELKEYLEKIKGTKILVRGNHDKKSDYWYIRQGFTVVCDSITINNVLMTHKPVKNLPSNILLNVHGHLHNTRSRHEEFVDVISKRHYLIAMEYTKYAPVLLDSVIGKYKKGV